MSISFGAKINVTPYLNEGLNLASIHRGLDELSLSERADFVKAIELIKNDKNIDSFEISGIPGSKIQEGKARLAKIVVDGQTQPLNGVLGVNVSDACQCINHVINFANKKYGKLALANSYSQKAQSLEEQTKSLSKTLKDKIDSLTGTDFFQRSKYSNDYIEKMIDNGDFIAIV